MPKRKRRRCINCDKQRPVGKWFGLCRACLKDDDARQKHLYDERPVAPEPCPYAPGTAGKILWMAERAKHRVQLFHKRDSTFDKHRPGIIQPPTWPEVYALPKLRVRGIERRHGMWIVRPMWEHKKHYLGQFTNESDALEAARRFWVHHLGLFWELGGAMRFYIRPGWAKEQTSQSE